jgi:hypothetical protein
MIVSLRLVIFVFFHPSVAVSQEAHDYLLVVVVFVMQKLNGLSNLNAETSKGGEFL